MLPPPSVGFPPLLSPSTGFAQVSERAITIAARLLERVLEHSPLDIRMRMVQAGASVAIAGCHQLNSDLPTHRFLFGQRTSEGDACRFFDELTGGVGGTRSHPCTLVSAGLWMMDGLKDAFGTLH